MSFTTYSGFVNEVKAFMDWSDATTSQIDSLIRMAEPMINSMLRVREMEATLVATVNSSGEAAVPSDYLEMKNAYIDGSRIKVLERSTVDYIFHAFPERTEHDSNQVRPKFARNGASFIFGPAQGDGDVLKGVYYKKPATTFMADSQTVHAAFLAYAQVYLFGVCANAEPYIGRDERIPTWKSAYDNALGIANGDTRREAASGGALTAGVS